MTLHEYVLIYEFFFGYLIRTQYMVYYNKNNIDAKINK
jgi:hypothetical protein